MARPLFEQYKDALRRGHVALLGGELEDALAAYRAAAELVPDRPLPHASIGRVLGRLGRHHEARAAVERALALAPNDEAALEVRRELDAAPAVAGPTAGLEPAAEPAAELQGEVADGSLTVAEVEASPAAEVAPEVQSAAWPAVDLPALPERASGQPPSGPPPDPSTLQAQVEAALEVGDLATARDALLRTVAVHREEGRLDAAMDACLQLLAIAPGDPRVHIAAANLQLDQGWLPVATEKIRLLLRLTALAGDTQAEADVHLLAADRLREDGRELLEAATEGAGSS